VAVSGGLPSGTRASLIERLLRALILDRSLYEEVADDRTGLSQAIGVVVLAGMASGARFAEGLGTVGLAFGVLVSLVSWGLLTVLVFAIGAMIFGSGRASLRTVAACLGFADMPAVVGLLAWIPAVGDLVRIVVWFWLLAATVVATSAAYRLSLARGAFLGGLGFTAHVLIGLLIELWATEA
jgi:hypothetical protein